jgi:NAD(P)-dependent dehydrogenase (short-subunit alcohol dehydrogenase family)
VPSPLDLRGSVALVTGASRGLGRALALALAEAGADLALAARSADDLARTVADATRYGVRAEAFPGDLRRDADVEGLVASVAAAFGRIDVLVNNAGISGPETPFLDLEPAGWDEVLRVNLRAPALLAQGVARRMVAQGGGGRIVNVASIGGLTPIARLGAYCVSKAGLIQLTRVMALELARHRVRVNAVCPGYFATPMNEAFFASEPGQALVRRAIPMRRLGDPPELASVVLLLASEASSFMTGSVVVIDGGQTLT